MMKIKHILAVLLMKCFQLLPINKNKVFLTSYQGTNYNSYPRKISEKLHDCGGFKIVWSLKSDIDAPSYIRKVKPESIRELFEIATSMVWVDNCRKNFWIRKKKKQLYIQTWHGPVCIKAVEADANLNDYYIKKAKNDSKMADYILSQCEWRTKNIKQAFWYEGKIIKADTNKFSHHQIEKAKKMVFDFYGLEKETKIILYAPTFRKGNDSTPYDVDFSLLKQSVEKRFGGKWIILFRLHPNITYKPTLANGVMDGGLYQDMDQLISSCDILVTDYSGCMFDAFKFRKIVFLYASDYQKYITEERMLYFDLKKFPAILSTNNEQLVQSINTLSVEKYLENVDSLNDYLGYYDKDAIEEIVSIIKRRIV